MSFFKSRLISGTNCFGLLSHSDWSFGELRKIAKSEIKFRHFDECFYMETVVANVSYDILMEIQ